MGTEDSLSVVRITIKKTLTQGGPSRHHCATGSFSSEYLVRTGAPFPSSLLTAYATGIAQAESRLYPACVRFDGAIVKLATPGASGEELRGQFSHVDLDKLCGQLPMSEDQVLAFPPVVAVYKRVPQWGQDGRLLMPHALTTMEWNLYAQKQVLPLRFQLLGGSAPTPFSNELMEAIRAEGGTFVMSGAEGDTEGSLRKIKGFFFVGFHVSSLETKRRKSGLTAKKPVGAKEPVEGIVYLLKAGPHFKIGKTINFEKRLGQIKLLLPDPVEVVHTIRAANPSAVESHWHRRFAPLRRNGEWFVLGEAEVAEFKSVSQM